MTMNNDWDSKDLDKIHDQDPSCKTIHFWL